MKKGSCETCRWLSGEVCNYPYDNSCWREGANWEPKEGGKAMKKQARIEVYQGIVGHMVLWRWKAVDERDKVLAVCPSGWRTRERAIAAADKFNSMVLPVVVIQAKER
jgi:hypothetical protein